MKIAFSDDHKTAAIVEVNSETDFVSKNEEFVAFVDDLAKLALTLRPTTSRRSRQCPLKAQRLLTR